MGVNENSEIVRTIITLAHSMSMNVTAKGGNGAQLQLRALKCEYGQGYCFSKPVDCKAARAHSSPAAVVLGLAIAPRFISNRLTWKVP